MKSQQNTIVYNLAPSLLQQQQQVQQQQYIEGYPFSPTTPQDLQFLSVANFSSHAGFEYEDFGQGFQHVQTGAAGGAGSEDVVQDMNGIEQERDPILSMLAEMAERDGGFDGEAPSVEEQRIDDGGWMEGGGNGGGETGMLVSGEGNRCLGGEA